MRKTLQAIFAASLLALTIGRSLEGRTKPILRCR